MHGQGRPHASPRGRFSLAIVCCAVAMLGGSFAFSQVPDLELGTGERAQSATPVPAQTSQPNIVVSGTNDAWPLSPTGTNITLSVLVQDLQDHARRHCRLICEVLRASDSGVVFQNANEISLDANGDAPPVSIEIPALERAGVYELRLYVKSQRPRIWTKLTGDRYLIAKTQSTLLAHTPSDENADSTAPRPGTVDSEAVNSLGRVRQADPNNWPATQWLPKGATRMVPSVKDVTGVFTSESQPDLPLNLCELPVGQSFTGQWPEIRDAQRVRIVVRILSDAVFGTPQPFEIQSANDPQFQVGVTRRSLSLDRSVFRRPKPLGGATGTMEILEWIDYLPAQPKYLRLTNSSPDRPLKIHSIEVFSVESGANPASERGVREGTESRGRNVVWKLTDPDWYTVATHDAGSDERGLDPETMLCHRLHIALQRLAENASWYGFDSVHLAELPATSIRQQTLTEAVRRWLETAGIALAPHLDELSAPRISCSPDRSTLQQFARATSEILPETLVVESPRATPAVSRRFRSTLHGFRRIRPRVERLASIDTSSQYVSAWVHQTGSNATGEFQSRIAFANQSPWPARIDLQFPHSRELACVLDGESDDESAMSLGKMTNERVVYLDPYGIVNLAVTSRSSVIGNVRWRSTIAEREFVLDALKTSVSEIVARLGTLAQPQDYSALVNGGFESEGQLGVLGWMHTQFPETAVVVDRGEAIQGERSLRMTNNRQSAGRTWLVSQPFSVPDSGRLAVSLAIRAEKRRLTQTGQNEAENQSMSRTLQVSSVTSVAAEKIRISLEGHVDDKPVRHSREISIPCDGQWQSRRIVLEAEHINHASVDSLRLTIDLLTPGKIWIDDVHLHDQFATHSERTALQGKAFLAVQGLQRGQVKAAADLLRNPHASGLISNPNPAWELIDSPSTVASAEDPAASSRNPTRRHSETPVPNSNNKKRRETVAERLRGWLPKPLRF